MYGKGKLGLSHCPQCGMFCRHVEREDAKVNITFTNGDEVCHGCQYANATYYSAYRRGGYFPQVGPQLPFNVWKGL